MSQLLGYALALVIGLSLGMLGGGGSIVTVPVFVYVIGFEPKDAIAMSLPVVGTTSLVGALRHWRAGNLDWRAVAVFGPLVMLGALGGARLAALVSGAVQLTILGVVMVAAGVLMLGDRAPARDDASISSGGARRYVILAASGLGVGVLTGLVGIGGGFLIVPALVLVARVPIKRAVGTSLLVITLSTVSALIGYRGEAAVAWRVVALFTALAVIGALVGTEAARHVPASGLRRAFGVVVLAIAGLILAQNCGVPSTGPTGAAPAERRNK